MRTEKAGEALEPGALCDFRPTRHREWRSETDCSSLSLCEHVHQVTNCLRSEGACNPGEWRWERTPAGRPATGYTHPRSGGISCLAMNTAAHHRPSFRLPC